MPGKSKIKYLKSLKIKKYRDIHGEFIMEGEKIIIELLENNPSLITRLIGTGQWLKNNTTGCVDTISDVMEVTQSDINKISSFKASGEVMAVLRIPEHNINKHEVLSDLSLVLDRVQDPGNLGNIIRIADWFGINNIFCSCDSVDCYNPKVVQATMGAIIRIKVHYLDLKNFLEEYSSVAGFNIYGTFLQGRSIYDEKLDKKAFVILGNESKGISRTYRPYIKSRLYIPKYARGVDNIESLNIASAAAIVCSEFRRKQ